jgi:hypothetical protein
VFSYLGRRSSGFAEQEVFSRKIGHIIVAVRPFPTRKPYFFCPMGGETEKI